MKKLLNFFFAIPLIAMGAFACSPKEEVPVEPVKYTLSADEAFVNGSATITVTGDKAVNENVTISIGVSEASVVKPEFVHYEPTLVIPAGKTSATMTITIPEKNLMPGVTSTVTVVASYNNFQVDQVVISASRKSIKGAWSVSGGKGNPKDIPMIEDEDGWYVTLAHFEAGDTFKFRRDASFTVALGLNAAGTPELEEPFALVDWDGCYNIGVAEAGDYLVGVNPDKMLGMIMLYE